jgi:hypothetical protein
MKVFFDMDPCVYMAAFAAQKKLYTVVYWEEDQGLQEKVFQDGNEKNKWLREIKEQELDIIIEDTEAHLVVEDEGFARQAAATTLKGALRAIAARFKVPEDSLEVSYYLTGKGNFREELATIAKYKGNRDKMEKPVHYQAVRDYLVDHWGAYVVDGIEADDEVSILAWDSYRSGGDHVLCTIDKDLDQVPGWHYDYKKKVFYETDPLDGELFFYAQILAGDSTDNIKGCYRIGIEKAKTLVNDWFDTCAESGHHEWRRYIWDHIVEQYALNKQKFPGKAYPEDMPAPKAALENARLVYMQQNRDELWIPPTEA